MRRYNKYFRSFDDEIIYASKLNGKLDVIVAYDQLDYHTYKKSLTKNQPKVGINMKSNKEEILRLYFKEKLKQVEISEIIGISKNAVSKVVKQDTRYKSEKTISNIDYRNWNKSAYEYNKNKDTYI